MTIFSYGTQCIPSMRTWKKKKDLYGLGFILNPKNPKPQNLEKT